MSRKNAIIAIALLPAAVGLVLLLLVSRMTLENWVLERSTREHHGLANSLAAGLTAQLDNQRLQLQLLAQGSDFAALPLQGQVERSLNGLPESLEPRKRALMEALRQQAGFAVVFVLSPNGDHYMSQPFAVQRNLRQFNLSGRPYFQQSQRTRTTVVSEMFLGADGVPAIAMNVPVMDSAGNIALYVGGVVHLTQLQSRMAPQHIAPFDLAVLRDGQGQVLARSDAIQSHPDSTALLALLDKSTPAASATLLRLGNGRWMDFSAPVGAHWTLHALRDENRLLAEITPAMARLTGAALLALLVPTLLGLSMALRYSRRAHQADRALQDANAQLVARVQARTQELSRSELRLRTLFESAADAVLIIEGTRIIECNPAAVALFGVANSNDLVGHDPSEFSPAEQPGNVASAELARQHFDALLRQPDQPLSFEWTHLRLSTGQTFVAMVRLSVMHIEGRELVQANVRDISERLQAQEDLRIAAKVFESWEGMTVTDAQNRILRVNSAFTRITGYAASEVIGQTPKKLQSGRHGPEFYRAMRHALATEGFWQGEVWNRRKNGEIYPQLLTISTVKNADGHTTHHVGIFLDQSSQRAAEQQIEHLAFYDPLTGLANRRLLLDRMAQARAASLRHTRHNALLLVDLDEFKLLNDSLGHEAGDAILQQLAQRLRRCLRDGDTAARCGGDEFALMLEDLSEDPLEAAAQAEVVAEKMRTELGTALYPARPRAPHHLQHWRGTVWRRWRKPDRLAPQAGRGGHVPGQAGRAQQHPLFRATNARGREPPRRAGGGAAPGHRLWTVAAVLPAPGQRRRAHLRRRGPGALAAPHARHGLAGRIHSPGRRNRAHPATGPVGTGAGLPPVGRLAGPTRHRSAERGRERERAPVSPPAVCRRGAHHLATQRRQRPPAQAGAD